MCGKLLEDWYPADICGECANRARSFDRGITCMQYRDMEKTLIRDLKYRGKKYLSRKLSEIIFDKIMAVGCEFDIIIPVPMYPAKEKERGYNQSALLGRYLGKLSAAECRTDILYRVRSTAPMNRLGAKERKRNLDGAFSVSEEGRKFLSGKRVLLIDDIYTTGTTMEHCSQLIRACGASEIIAVSLAAGINQRELPVIQTDDSCDASSEKGRTAGNF